MTTWPGWALRRARASALLLATLFALVAVTTGILAFALGNAGALATAAARGAASVHAAAGRSDEAERTLRAGLTLVPRSQALWRDLLRLLGGTDPDSAIRVNDEMAAALAGDGPEPETSALVGHLVPAARELG